MKNQNILTPDWVFEKVPNKHIADGNGNVRIYTNESTNANLIELALDTCKVLYEKYDFNDEDYDFSFGFVFRIESLMDNCPNFYICMKEKDDEMKRYLNSLIR